MGIFTEAKWEADPTLPGRANRRGGSYWYYLPDRLTTLQVSISPQLSEEIAAVERRVLALAQADGITELEDLSRFLLRSEAIASSQIEGIVPAAKQVALAEIGEAEDIRGISDAAKLVARNMTVVREASDRLARSQGVAITDLEQLQRALLGADHPAVGIRTVQNWVGTSNYHPIGAEYVPPAPRLVLDLLEDLLSYLNGATHGPLVQAALVHAQFESIHPFVDGNGRVGRALIHTVLTRRGLTSSRLLPVSLVLATFREQYVAALNDLRFEGSPEAPENARRIAEWIRIFSRAVDEAVTQAEDLRAQLLLLAEQWRGQLEAFRAANNYTRALRSDSGVARILGRLAGTPVLTVKTASQIYGLSVQNASEALTQLADAGIFSTRSIARGTTAFIANEVLDLVTLSERKLASTQFDTRVSKPVRQVPRFPRS
ncbi:MULTISPECIES: Fic family protein [Actinomycetaceae]|uniref:Fic family protein n=1 Tax=Actinomycetaceae TaxID=2049 RepID=UPI0009300511|nr:MULTISPECIES: Fic family protein [Actinomycetaceae]MDP9835246.1 Fic family protein [Gleimia europaea]